MAAMSDVTRQRLEVSNDQVDLPFFAEFLQSRHTDSGLTGPEQVPGDRPLVADLVVDVGQTPAVDFCHFKITAEVSQSTVKGRDGNGMSFSLQVRDYFVGPR